MVSSLDAQRDHFEQTTAQYDNHQIINPPAHVEEEIELLRRSIRHYAPNTPAVVDFGAGTGRLTIPLLQSGLKVLAVDISEGSLQRLVALANQIGCGDELTSTTSLPSSGSHSLIVGADVLHHVDIPPVVKQFSAIMPDGGTCIFSEPNVLNLSWALFITLTSKTSWHVESGIIFCNYFSLRRSFMRAGFAVTIKGFALMPPQLFGWSKTLTRFNYWLGDLPLFKLFAFRLIVIATKRGHE